MDEDRLREWVEKKIESGVSKDRVKRSLENTGHDPSIVDEVKQATDPFQESGKEFEEQHFGGESQERTVQEDSKQDEEDIDFSEQESPAEPGPDERRDIEESGSESSESVEESSGTEDLDEEDFETGSGDESMLEKARVDKDNNSSSKTGEENQGFEFQAEEETGERSHREIPIISGLRKLPLKKVSVVLAVIVLSAGIYSFMPENAVSTVTQPFDDLASSLGSSPADGECPNVGVLIRSLSSSEGVTIANVRVSRGEAEVVLEVFREGEKVGETTKTVSGEEVMSVNAVGDRATFHPVGCERFISKKNY